MRNKYYILSLPEQALTAILEHTDIVQNKAADLRYNNTKTKCIVKTKVGSERPNALPGNVKGMTHAEVKAELSKPEWVTEV